MENDHFHLETGNFNYYYKRNVKHPPTHTTGEDGLVQQFLSEGGNYSSLFPIAE